MDDAKQQLIEKLQSSNNILVTVSRNPSVDQLASCIGLTLLLNKQGKHAAAVFSGKVPSTLEFLQPEETLEKNTDSLRDFIISLDKTKADKLRYKVEEDVVRIFITPYKTSLSQEDLEFSEGDFNVDVVVALGVGVQEDLDQAITAHGRILHDATVTTINATTDNSGLGTINWNDPQASSLSELVTDLTQILDASLLDSQIATSLLTGIVSETGRFSNDKTSSQTMSASAALMAAGANQQLVATKLETEGTQGFASGGQTASGNSPQDDSDGVLEIDHVADSAPHDLPPAPVADELPPAPEPALPEPPAFSEPQLPVEPETPASNLSGGSRLITEPPKLGGKLTANSEDQDAKLDPTTDPFSLPASEPPQLLDHKDKTAPQVGTPFANPVSQPPAFNPNDMDAVEHSTLTDLEKSVHSPHLDPANLDTARNEVDRALSGTDQNDPIEALNAQPLGGELHASQPEPSQLVSPDPVPALPAQPPATPLGPSTAAPPPHQSPAPAPAQPPADTQAPAPDPNAPPPVPPPIPFQFGNSPPPQ